MTKDELLAVLDMSEDEQKEWVCKFACPDCDNYSKELCPSLADLAFRLRDEASRIKFSYGINEVQKYLGITEESLESTAWECAYWGMILAKPIHWIIAALIAKESK